MTNRAYSGDVPVSMRDELASWNGGNGVDLETWIGCEGRFALAVGYTTLFWPEFEVIDGYILRKGTAPSVVKDFEQRAGATRWSVENTLNHLHLVDLHYRGCLDGSPDKLIVIGNTLQKIYDAKLQLEFPDRPCTVRFYVPENVDDVDEYQISFWHRAHEVT
jgi:hypothetical protein